MDHSQSNTLMVNRGNHEYDFHLVDLNRMNFHGRPLSFRTRMRNFSRLTDQKEIVRVMSQTYAGLIERDFDSVYSRMWKETKMFFRKMGRKQKFKAIFSS